MAHFRYMYLARCPDELAVLDRTLAMDDSIHVWQYAWLQSVEHPVSGVSSSQQMVHAECGSDDISSGGFCARSMLNTAERGGGTGGALRVDTGIMGGAGNCSRTILAMVGRWRYCW